MALTNVGLDNGGLTPHYQFQYDDSLRQTPANPGGPEPARTNAVIRACESDFGLMAGWFAGVVLDVNIRIPVNVTPSGGGAKWSLSGRNLTVTINPANGDSTLVRYLLVSEMVEQFMRSQGPGWFGNGTEGSQGEGLSRFLAAQFLAINGLGPVPDGFTNSNIWLAGTRGDFVNNQRDTDDGPDDVTGCSLLFIYYLFSQLGFTINAIVAADADTLAGVYLKLTGDISDPFPDFKQLIDIAFPASSVITIGDLDNPFPIALFVWHHDSTQETQLWFLDNHQVTGRATVLAENGTPLLVGSPWSIVGTTDIDGNGKADIVWHNSSSGETQIWFLNGFQVTRRSTVLAENGTPIFVGSPWAIVGTRKLHPDGEQCIFWYNSSTGETQIWFLDNFKLTGRATVLAEDGKPILVGPPWSVVGIGDMNGDGKADIVWHNSSSGETQIWFLKGFQITGRATVLAENGTPIFVGPPWRIVGTNDMNGDGKADIVWHNSSTGETQIWFMDGFHLIGRATVVAENGKAILVGAPWNIVAAGKPLDRKRAGFGSLVRSAHP
jgi:FG-GAP-like repeat